MGEGTKIMKSVFLGLALVAAMLGGTTAQAGFVSGSATFGSTATTPESGGTALDARAISNVTKTSGTTNFANVSIPNLTTQWANFSITNPMNSVSLSTLGFGTFASIGLTSDTGLSGIVNGNGNRVITFSGLFVGGTLFAPNLRDATASTLTITLNQVDVGGTPEYSTSVRLVATGTQAVPEPTSIALFGLGALGLVARRFRRK